MPNRGPLRSDSAGSGSVVGDPPTVPLPVGSRPDVVADGPAPTELSADSRSAAAEITRRRPRLRRRRRRYLGGEWLRPFIGGEDPSRGGDGTSALCARPE